MSPAVPSRGKAPDRVARVRFELERAFETGYRGIEPAVKQGRVRHLAQIFGFLRLRVPLGCRCILCAAQSREHLGEPTLRGKVAGLTAQNVAVKSLGLARLPLGTQALGSREQLRVIGRG